MQRAKTRAAKPRNQAGTERNTTTMSFQQPPGYPPQGYGPPPGYPPQGYGPPPPPPKKGMSGAAIALLIVAGLFVLGGGSCVLCLAVGASAGGGKSNSSSFGGPATKPNETAMPVDIRTILTAYKGNEIAADNTYKDKLVQITGGTVDDVKKDILDEPYVTVGTGAAFEIPQVQCSLRSEQSNRAATLQKGQRVTVRGRVHGLLMNVQIHDCEIL